VTLRVVIAVLAAIGAAIAGYLTYVHYADVAPICTTGGCETVQKSSYAELGGVPVALLGLLAYVVLFALAWVRGEAAAAASTVVALIGVGFSGYLLWAQLGPIGAVCQWCVAQDVVIACIAVLSVVRLLREERPAAAPRARTL
jgi:uncharacterized membrane protein